MLSFRNCLHALCLFGTPFVAFGVVDIEADPQVEAELIRNYRIYAQTNAKRFADQQIAQELRHAPDPTRVLFSKQEAVRLPICDLDRPPQAWTYVAPSAGERSLHFVGHAGHDAQYLQWTDAIWLRIAGDERPYRSGMYCGRPYEERPNVENFAVIDLGSRLFEPSPATRAEISDALLALASKVRVDYSRVMTGSLQLGGLGFEEPLAITLELWRLNADGFKRVASVNPSLSFDDVAPKMLTIEALIDAQSETFMVLRLAQKAQKTVGKIYVMDARLEPKR